MAKDPIKKADNGTYYFRANLGYNKKRWRFFSAIYRRNLPAMV